MKIDRALNKEKTIQRATLDFSRFYVWSNRYPNNKFSKTVRDWCSVVRNRILTDRSSAFHSDASSLTGKVTTKFHWTLRASLIGESERYCSFYNFDGVHSSRGGNFPPYGSLFPWGHQSGGIFQLTFWDISHGNPWDESRILMWTLAGEQRQLSSAYHEAKKHCIRTALPYQLLYSWL